MKGNMGVIGMDPEMVLLDVTTKVKSKPTLGWFPTPGVGLDMMIVCGEGGS